MSLLHLKEQATPVEGVYACFWYYGYLVLTSLPPEDTIYKQKREGDLYTDTELQLLTPQMYSVVSGRVKTERGESPLEAMTREMREETGLRQIEPAALNRVLTPPTQTIQQRNERLLHISGDRFDYELSPLALNLIDLQAKREGRSTMMVHPRELADLPASETRPFLKSVIAQILLGEQAQVAV